MHRVVVTGIGALTPIGSGVERFWNATLEGRVGVGPITRFDVDGYASKIAAQIDDFDASEYMERRRVRWTDRFSQFAVAAARDALDDAAFSPNGNHHEVGVWIGSALGGAAFADEQHDVFRRQGLGAVKPLLAIAVFGGAATSNIALEFDFRGPSVANANSCAAGAVAIGDAYRAIARGDVRAAVAGGVEAPLSPLAYGAFTVIGAMSKRNDDPLHASRPFDRERDGFVMAEGAGILVLERLEDARARDARIYGEIAGYGLSTDAHHMAAPRPDGECSAQAMQVALAEARLATEEIEAINAHGSGTPIGDRVEAIALRRVFGESLERIPVVASKGQHGHALGASGAWEAVLSLLMIERKVLPRVTGLIVDDPECALDFVRETGPRAVRTVLSNTAGFGGLNAALIFSAVE
ncbi:MAG: beta-ketoacyl-[acyl-carrier-protein] synthase family protein [Candidatus Eremiobacteraeota bacterium]|nr:beta-ketoacyl-[acyl-carrier-protein] synthase family protein [Candidatus Eremiobacteraeota bacterium]MBV8354252.1 beta-ketoacyl-[acyl-carrier-protein] synthase family protein [Candidatus Eremiobacteraeota bacterium]